jgi:peptide/nickel transport system substrate-binding protein
MTAAAAVKGGTLTVVFLTTIEDTGDLHRTSSSHSAFLAGHTLDTLIRKKPEDASYHPGLAISWQIAADNRSITLRLRDNVRFHDGTPFNAEAVKFNLDRIVTLPEAKGRRAWGFLGGTDNYERTEVLNNLSVRVVFKRVYARMLDVLSTNEVGGMHSPTAIRKFGAAYGTDALVGTGPFKFVKWTGPNGEVSFVRNDDYNWASPIYRHQGPAYLDGFTVKGSLEPGTRSAALEAGSVDVAFLQEKDINRFATLPGFKTIVLPKQGTTRGMAFNLKRPILQDARVRQAIAHAIDREGLVRSPRYSGVGKPSLALLTAVTWGASTEEFRSSNFLYDPARATSLLEAAGWRVRGPDGVREAQGVNGVNDGTRLQLTEVVLAEVPQDSELIQGMLAKVGVKTELRVHDFDTYASLVRGGNYDLAMWSTSGSQFYLLEALFHSRRTFMGYSNPKVDALFEQAGGTLDPAKQRDLFREIQLLILKDIPFTPVVDWMYPWAMKKGVEDLTTDASGIGLYLYDAWVNPRP